MNSSEPIEAIRKRFDREWLLIAVDTMDEATTTPLTGELLSHSPRRDDIYHASQKNTDKLTLLIYSQEDFAAGHAAAFHALGPA